MKFPKNISDVGALQPDFMGFIFYPKSKRFVGENFPLKSLAKLPEKVQKVAVFVNESPETVVEVAKQYAFDFVQLHGTESVETCAVIKEKGIKIIKAFSVDNFFNFEDTTAFESVCDYFLFDTKTDTYGGSGRAFDWQILEQYTLSKPFFLSGGLSFESLGAIQKLNFPMLQGLDFNSKLEDTNYKKITEEVDELIYKIRTQ